MAKTRRTRINKEDTVKDIQAREDTKVTVAADPIVSSASGDEPVSKAEEDSGDKWTGHEAELTEKRDAAATEVSVAEVAVGDSTPVKGGFVQKCMRVPSFRRQVISHLLKKLR